ncbi:hypothetical protein ROZALSC1DRAFT_28974 [Rozella allomycis CSF55]|uniref:Uncharacterized protein n=1 Tax=Rozella allomycis (strain CSF55) TaxID=988480 RepID=A0A075AUT8_ROZAC|nr:hypothetical protein O9G_004983 [Rozella allomycis CSF55]RKP19432.1 hypothetical protein ROZALSC1DRAFT_28974 [Rozella allomycis CSF55]|eukprot:EPZ34046.1 hypothetical protein O9G_004983 [Rozella allomycis CSF55]
MCAILSQQTVHKVWRRHVVKSGADYLRFPYLDVDFWLNKVRDLQGYHMYCIFKDKVTKSIIQGHGLFIYAKFNTVYQYFDFKC